MERSKRIRFVSLEYVRIQIADLQNDVIVVQRGEKLGESRRSR